MASAQLPLGAWPTRITTIMRTISLKAPPTAGAAAHTLAPATGPTPAPAADLVALDPVPAPANTARSRSAPSSSSPSASSWGRSRSAPWASRSLRWTRRQFGRSNCARRTRSTAPAIAATAAATGWSAAGARSRDLANGAAPHAAHAPRPRPPSGRPCSRARRRRFRGHGRRPQLRSRVRRRPGAPRRRGRNPSPSPLLRPPPLRSPRPHLRPRTTMTAVPMMAVVKTTPAKLTAMTVATTDAIP
jgi:hypothetical protein